MGKVKEKELPTPDTNPVDGDALIKETKPKKVKKTEEKLKDIKSNNVLVNTNTEIKGLKEDIDKLGDWLVRVDQELTSLRALTDRIANRMGLNEWVKEKK